MAKKQEVHKVLAQIEAPSKSNPAGRITTGFYTVVKSTLTMTDADGVPMRRDDGEMYTHKLAKGENPRSMACVLTKQVRAAVHGYSALSGPKREPIVYPKCGWR
jgi:hypothetical protein